MRSGAIAAAVTTAVLYGVGARAQAPELTRVAVDWSRVSDADVERCGLSQLRAGTIERLVDEGHAVVETIDPGGIRVAVASTPAGLNVHVEGAGVARDETLHAGKRCDATFVLEVISRISELVDEVAEARRARPPTAPVQAPPPANAPTAQAPPPPPARSAVQGSIDATLRINESPDWLLGGGLGVRARLPAGWEAGARVELLGAAHLEVTVMEGFVGVVGAWQPHLPGVGPYLELGPVLHRASSDARSEVELDAALAAGLQLGFGHLLGHLLVYGRLRSFEHRVGGETAFDTGRVGLILRIGAQLSGS
jgi:hypothetical protein